MPILAPIPDRPADMTSLPEVLAYVEKLEDEVDDRGTTAKAMSEKIGEALEEALGAIPEWGTLDKNDDGSVDGKAADSLLDALAGCAYYIIDSAPPEVAARAWKSISRYSYIKLQLLTSLPKEARRLLAIEDFTGVFTPRHQRLNEIATLDAFLRDGGTSTPPVDLCLWKTLAKADPVRALKLIHESPNISRLPTEEDLLNLTGSSNGETRSLAILAMGLVGSAPKVEADTDITAAPTEPHAHSPKR